MFREEVKKDTRNYRAWLRKQIPASCKNLFSAAEHILHSSNVFHFQDLDTVLENVVKDNLFLEQSADVLTNLPYQNLWIDFTCSRQNITKTAILATSNVPPELNSHFIFFMAHYAKRQKFWILNVNAVAYTKTNRFKVINMKTGETLRKRATTILSNNETRVAYETVVLAAFLRLLNCKNIVEDKVKIKNKLPGRPEIIYKTLVIKKPSRQVKVESELTGITKLHLCRGHFKTFTSDRPLLGRAVGTYWWQPQVRGKAENGEIRKSYVLRAN